MFTKDLKQFKVDLEAADDKAAVIQRYEKKLVAKTKVRCKFLVKFWFHHAHIAKYAQALKMLEGEARETALIVARDRRIDQ